MILFQEAYIMTKTERFFEALKNKKVALIGTGVSHNELIDLFLSKGITVTILDRKTREQFDPELYSRFESKGAHFILGDAYLDSLCEFDVVYRTPGMYYNHPKLIEARAQGVVITSEMESFFDLCPCKTYAVTGSDGKTTTTTLISEFLKTEGYKVWLGGNIGTPLLDKIPEMTENDVCVTELSSFQLMDMKRSPDIAVVTNLAPNHLDKHGSMEEYCEAKKNIFLHQNQKGILVVNADCAVTAAFAPEAKGELRMFSRKNKVENGVYFENGELIAKIGGKEIVLFRSSEIKIPGLHNVENYMTAAAAVFDLCAPSDMASVAKEFGGVEHRLEFVRELRGVKYYNSSIDSSPSRTSAALGVFDKKVIVIVGGSDKGIAFDGLGDTLCEKAKAVILAGQTGEKIALAVKNSRHYAEGNPLIADGRNVVDATKLAAEIASEGDIVLLSPACASFDAFKNFDQRGKVFKKAVLDLE